MRIRNISLRVVSLLVLTFVFVVATTVFTLFDIRIQTENMETSLAEEARTFAREMDAVWEFMDNSQYTIFRSTSGARGRWTRARTPSPCSCARSARR